MSCFSPKTSAIRLPLVALSLLGAVLASCQGQQVAKKGQQAQVIPTLGGTPRITTSRALSMDQGARLFHTWCSSCHGEDGRGQTTLAADLDPPPLDLSQCNFKLRSTPSGSLPTDEDLLRTLYVGLPGSTMPSFSTLLPTIALEGLVQQVKARCARFAQEAPDDPLPLPRRALYSEASVSRGKKIFQREKCASCHGSTGAGDGPAATTLKDLGGRALRPRNLRQGIFRSGLRRIDIYRAFSTGLDGTPMPALPAQVATQDRWDLTHYLVSLSYQQSALLRALRSSPTWYEPIRTWGLPWR